ncbi:MAG TPA: DJ-1/PfpI family protein [Thermoanaerobaculia bacterium]|jgi:cyclohexyl-isocyanide hydratase|nr:DJ-1/PfpI family protein [Thermoanaerobaculia bacterium]
MRIAALVFPRLTQLDLTGPYEVWSRVPGAEVMLVASSLEAVRSEFGLPIVPSTTFDDAPQSDLLFCPGGPGVNDAILDQRLLSFIRAQAEHAQFVTAVCTGSLILGAAGLLDGYRAATHWTAMELLPLFGAIPVDERVVRDRNRITGGGVTAGIDFALAVVAEWRGPEVAKQIQLAIEYDPQPPFDSGHPRRAERSIVDSVMESRMSAQQRRRDAVVEAARRLGK